MSRKLSVLGVVLVLIFSLALTGCGNPVKDDLLSYDGQLDKTMKAITEFETAAGNAKTETYKKDITENVIPKVKEVKKQLEAINIKTTEVKDVNKLFIDAMDKYVESFTQMADAAEKGDTEGVKKATDVMNEGQKKIDESSKKFEELCKANDIEVKK
jgi:hypothetical protein